MDLSTDIWGQLAVEAAQVYLPDGTIVSPFANTVCNCKLPLISLKKSEVFLLLAAFCFRIDMIKN